MRGMEMINYKTDSKAYLSEFITVRSNEWNLFTHDDVVIKIMHKYSLKYLDLSSL